MRLLGVVVTENCPCPKSQKCKVQSSDSSWCYRETYILTPNTKEVFNQLRQAFTEVSILQHFDPECHIRIETDTLGYTIGGVLSQLTSDHLTSDQDQWHLVAYFLKKMILAETKYETHNGELLIIIEAFKIWRHYLKAYKHEVLILTNHNNLCWFMDTKSLSSKQVRWAQELFCYYFQIDYYSDKANEVADALSRYLPQSVEEGETLWAENVKILHYL